MDAIIGRRKKLLQLAIILLLLIILYFLYSLYRDHHRQLVLYGNVDIRDVNLGFRVTGRLMGLKVDEGDSVQPGELIGRLDPAPYQREVQAAQATLSQKKALLAYADTVYAREKRLAGTGASSVDRYENALKSLNAAKADLEKAAADLAQSELRLQDTNLYAPSAGMILTRAAEPGTMLSAGQTVVTETLINPIWVRAYVSEKDLGRAKPGTKVEVYSDSFPQKAFEGQIGFVSPTAEFTPKTVETPDLRTELVYRLRIVMHDPNHELRQGMPVTVKIVNK